MKAQGTNKMNLTFLLSRVSSEARSSSSQRSCSSPDASNEVATHAFPCSPVSSKGPTLGPANTKSTERYRLKSCDELRDSRLLEIGKQVDVRLPQCLQSSFDTDFRERTAPTGPDRNDHGERREFNSTSGLFQLHSERAMTSMCQQAIAKDSPGLMVSSKSHKCFCGRVFNKREHLKRHDLLVHKDFRPFSCDDCSLRFGTKQNYQVHLTTNKHRQRIHFNTKRNIVGDPV